MSTALLERSVSSTSTPTSRSSATRQAMSPRVFDRLNRSGGPPGGPAICGRPNSFRTNVHASGATSAYFERTVRTSARVSRYSCRLSANRKRACCAASSGAISRWYAARSASSRTGSEKTYQRCAAPGRISSIYVTPGSGAAAAGPGRISRRQLSAVRPMGRWRG